ncbi:MAG: 2-dehydropantoate 2-reductase N-terminal domain-containing protein, partial [Dehalococcoidia bacterium]
MTAPFGRAAVVGATAWGTTLAVHLARNGQPVTLLARSAEEARALDAVRANERRLPGVPFPDGLAVAHGSEALAGAGLVCFVVPSRTLWENACAVAAHV